MTNTKKQLSIFKDVDMTGGALPASLVTYAVPLLVTSILQTLYHAADIAVIGNFGSDTSVASIGATTVIIHVLVNVFMNIVSGANLLFARYRGARDTDGVKDTLSTTYAFSMTLGVILMIAGLVFAKPMLVLTKCPGEVIVGAELYLKIYMIGVPASAFFNFMAAVLRSMGDSRRPFIYLSISGIVNVIFNLIFVLGFGMDVEGVAIATVISQYLSAVLLFVRLVRFDDENRLYPFNFKIRFYTLRKIVRYGIPSSISAACFSLSNVFIQSALNELGPYAIAGEAAVSNVMSLVLFSVAGPLSQTTSAFIGQNIGAGNRERCMKIARQMYVYGVIAVAALGVLCLVFIRPLLSLFVPGDAAAIEFGTLSLRLRCYVFAFYAIMQISNGVLQAFGYTTYQMVNSMVFIVGIRFLWMLWIYRVFPSEFALLVCYPITWVAAAVGAFAVSLFLLSKYKRGKEFKL